MKSILRSYFADCMPDIGTSKFMSANQLVRFTAVFVAFLLVTGCAAGQVETDAEIGAEVEEVGTARQAIAEIKDCGWAADEIDSAGDYVANHWSSYEAFVEDEAGVKIGTCLKNRFKTNGKVECDLTQGSCGNGNINGWASFLSHRMHICVDPFLDNIEFFSEDNKEACLVALMTHEFGHTCWRGHDTVEDMDDAAFEWFANRADKNVTITMASCGMD